MILSNEPRRRSRGGAAAVEFAMCGSFFLLLFFGIVELSRAMMVTHILNIAALYGARVGSTGSPTETESDMTTRVTNALTGSSGWMTTNCPSDVTAAATVNVYVAPAPTTAALASPSMVSPSQSHTMSKAELIQVVITVPLSKVSWATLYISSSTTLGGSATTLRQ